MERWICTICQYVYDPATGDPDKGIPAGTPFESLPDDWACPLCGAGKDAFEKEEFTGVGTHVSASLLLCIRLLDDIDLCLTVFHFDPPNQPAGPAFFHR